MYYLALDVGGTKTSVALFQEDGTLCGDILQRKSRTYEGEDCVYENSCIAIRELLSTLRVAQEEIIAIGVGGPGPLNCKTGVIIHAPMMNWHNFPLAARLQEDFKVPVFLDNDGNLGALAEQRCGVAKGMESVGYMTVSTGIGGGLVFDGEIYHGYRDGAGEFGHLSINPEGPRCPCGSYGCLELYASGTAVSRQLREDFLKGIKSSAFEISTEPGCRELAIAAEQGDLYALEKLRELGYHLGLGISNIFNLLNLQILVLGGGVTKAHRWFEESMLSCIEERCMNGFSREQVAFSKMNDSVVIYGAYYLAKDKISRK